MKIELNRGVDDIVFGMSEAEIIGRLGQPDKVWVTEYKDRELYYYRLKLVLKIESENENKLGWIEVCNRQARWEKIDPWTMEKTALLSLIAERLNDSYQVDDYGSMESYSFDKNWIELQYQFGELAAFNLGVAYDDDKPLWSIQEDLKVENS